MSPDEVNPYSTPLSDVASASDDARLSGLATGQRLVIYAILANIGLFVLQLFSAAADPDSMLLAVGLLVCSLAILVLGGIGIWMLSRGLGNGIFITLLLMFLMLIPLIGLLALLVMNSRATSELRAGGYQVGLLGARGR